MTEWADLSSSEVNNVAHTASGAIAFADSDTLDIHSASVNARGTGYLGSFTLNSTNIDTQDAANWSFTVSDKALDYLKAGELITQSYDVAIDDGHGGVASQTVTIVINGADDVTVAKTTGRGSSGGGNGKGKNGNDDAAKNDKDGAHDVRDDQIPAPASDETLAFKSFAPASLASHDNGAEKHAAGHDAVAIVMQHVPELAIPHALDALQSDHGWLFT